MTTTERLRTRSDEPRRLGIGRARSVGFGPTRCGDVLVGPGAGRPTEWAGRTAAGPDGMNARWSGSEALAPRRRDAAPASPPMDREMRRSCSPPCRRSPRRSGDRSIATSSRAGTTPSIVRNRVLVRVAGAGPPGGVTSLGSDGSSVTLSTTDEPTFVPSAEPSHRPRSRTDRGHGPPRVGEHRGQRGRARDGHVPGHSRGALDRPALTVTSARARGPARAKPRTRCGDRARPVGSMW
jgi:hypothetical protein